MKNKYVVAIVLWALLVGTLFGYNIRNIFFQDKEITVRANFYVFCETIHGNFTYESHNTVTNIFLKFLRDSVGFNNATGWNATQWIAIGNLSGTAASTKLDVECTNASWAGSGRTQASVSANTNYVYNATVTFHFTTGGSSSYPININTAALMYSGVASADNSMAAFGTLSPNPTFNSGDNMTVTWNNAVSGT
jgi:hypothetical protein